MRTPLSGYPESYKSFLEKEWFSSDVVKARLSAAGSSPRSPETKHRSTKTPPQTPFREQDLVIAITKAIGKLAQPTSDHSSYTRLRTLSVIITTPRGEDHENTWMARGVGMLCP